MMEDVVVSVDAKLLDSLVTAIALIESDIDRLENRLFLCMDSDFFSVVDSDVVDNYNARIEKRCRQRDLLTGFYENLRELWLKA